MLRGSYVCILVLVLKMSTAEEILESDPCHIFDTVNITDGQRDDNGSITHNNITYSSKHYKTYNYTLNSKSIRKTVAEHTRGCICEYRACVRSCCEPGQTDDVCSEFNRTQILIDNEYHDHSKFVITYGHVCESDESFIVRNDTKWEMRHNKEDDTIHLVLDDDVDDAYVHTEYCLFRDNGTLYPEACFPNSGDVTEDPDRKLHFGMTLSVPFLIATFVVYAFVPELRTTLLGKSLMCYVLSLAIAFSFLSAVNFNNDGEENHPIVCKVVAFTIYTSFLTSFFWLCVISFDIWWTFGSNSGRRQRFKYYNFFVWSFVAIYVTITVILEKMASDDWSPGFKDACWFSETNKAVMWLFYFPLLVVVLVNIVFFSMTARQMMKSQKQARAMSEGDSRRICKAQSDMESFSLFVRLFIIMGVSWIMEVVSIFYEPHSWFWYITDLLNCLQGVIIFFLFVWKLSVWKLVTKRFRNLRCMLISESDSNTTQPIELNNVADKF